MKRILKILLLTLCWILLGVGTLISLLYPISLFVRLVASVRSLKEFFYLGLEGFVVMSLTVAMIAFASYIKLKLEYYG